jgi:alkanesulfonate monooxygenase SsuD/methylene tetrahydromethanopterin reductase-like flavin-dependent oxidoreductase (luciferase family)
LGGETGHTLQRVVDFCDGWLPRGRGGFDIAPSLADLRDRAAKAGRDMKTISVTVFGASADAAVLDRYTGLGITRVTFGLPSKDRETVLPLLDRYAKLIR